MIFSIFFHILSIIAEVNLSSLSGTLHTCSNTFTPCYLYHCIVCLKKKSFQSPAVLGSGTGDGALELRKRMWRGQRCLCFGEPAQPVFVASFCHFFFPVCAVVHPLCLSRFEEGRMEGQKDGVTVKRR